ncbi:GNAT family N-acetyltransferase [Hyphococcus sp.]|uniref:GNAT family N-acetyltransferase n=1 Tax=Hyphococcus sp. TaxID=2038636 RepID=UPI0035C670B2
MSESIPVIDTERLQLKGPKVEDFPAFAAMWARPELTREITGKPLTEEEAWTRLLRNAGLWPLVGYGYWHVFERNTDALVGQVGFADFHRNLTPSLREMPEIGWIISPDHQGKGYATEAARAAIRWGDANFSEKKKMCCIIGVENTPSICIAEKCGFSFIASAHYNGKAINVYHRPIAPHG